jgi:hypothetical protein
MLEERTIYLINTDLDDELGADEKAELEAMLESSSEARAMRAELLRLNNLLDSLPEQSPPPGLARQLLDRLAPQTKSAGFSLSGIFSSFQPATAGLAFAAGLLLTVGYYELSPGRQSAGDTASMVGTMVSSQQGNRGLLDNDLLLSGDGFSGALSLRQSAEVYVLNFDLESENQTEIEVGLEHTGLSFGGFAEIQSDESRVFETVAISGGTLRVVNQGSQQFAVFLQENGHGEAVDTGSITIDFSGDGGRLHRDLPEL